MNEQQKKKEPRPKATPAIEIRDVETTFTIQCEGHTFEHVFPAETAREHRNHGNPDLLGVECPTCKAQHDLIGDQIGMLVEQAHKDHLDKMKQPATAIHVHMKSEHRRATIAQKGEKPVPHRDPKAKLAKMGDVFEPEEGAVVSAVGGKAVKLHEKKGGGGGKAAAGKAAAGKAAAGIPTARTNNRNRKETIMKALLATIIGLALASGPAWADETKKTEPAKTEVKAEAKAPVAAPAAASQPTEPATTKDAIDTGKKAIEAAKNHQWWYFSALVILVLMFVLKLVKVLDKIGRWKYIILPVLSVGAALLAAFQGGVSLEVAVNVFAASWSTGMLQQLVEHGILGKPHTPGDGT